MGHRDCPPSALMRQIGCDGKPVQQLEHDLPPDNAPGITKIVREIVHRTAEQALMEDTPLEITFVRSREIGSGELNEDTARTKR
jgi:hypothetical protein